MKRVLNTLLSLVVAFQISTPVYAQNTQAYIVVSSCGTLPVGLTLTAGRVQYGTMDTTGKICSAVTATIDTTGLATSTKQDTTNTNLGAPADSAASAGGTGSISAKLREISAQLNATLTANKSNSTPVLLNALSTTVTAVKSSAGVLTDLYCVNPNTSDAFIQVFDSSSPTLGMTTPVLSFRIIGSSSSSGGFVFANAAYNFATAIKVAATTTATGSLALSTALDCNAGYR